MKSVGLKHCNNPKSFIEYSNDTDDGIYENTDENNSNRELKIFTVFDDMIADIFSNKNVRPIVTKAFIRSRKIKISFVFIT